MRHEHVLRCLERTDLFTVDPYAAEMARATDDPAKSPGAYAHFMLGTDRDELYAARRRDPAARGDARRRGRSVTAIARDGGRALGEYRRPARSTSRRPSRSSSPCGSSATTWASRTRPTGEPSPLPGLCGGDTFPLDDDLTRVFSFTRIDERPRPDGRRPVRLDQGRLPQHLQQRRPGRPAVRRLPRTGRHRDGVPDRLRPRPARGPPGTGCDRGRGRPGHHADPPAPPAGRGAGPGGSAVEHDVTRLLGAAPPAGEVARRLSDSMIRSNVFGTVVGAVVNPQEATARIVDSVLRLQDGEFATAGGSCFDDAAALAAVDEDEPGYAESLERTAPVCAGGAAPAAAGRGAPAALRAGHHRARRASPSARARRSSWRSPRRCATRRRCRSR